MHAAAVKSPTATVRVRDGAIVPTLAGGISMAWLRATIKAVCRFVFPLSSQSRLAQLLLARFGFVAFCGSVRLPVV